MRAFWREIAGAFVVLAVRMATLPATPWTTAELTLMAALNGVDPQLPPSPVPLHAGLARVVYFFVVDPFRSLVVLHTIAAAIGFVALARCFEDRPTGAAASLVFWLSSGVLAHPQTAVPMMFVALALHAFSSALTDDRGRATLFLGVWSACAIGCEPRLAPAIAAMLLAAVPFVRRRAYLLSFAAVALWLPAIPIPHAPSGIVRFTLHAWGSKLVTIPLLLCVVAGVVPPPRRRVWPLLAFAVVHLIFTVTTANPLGSIAPAVPAMLLFATLAALGLRRFALPGAALIAILSLFYVWPLLRERHTSYSPIVDAAAHVKATLPRNGVVLYEAEARAVARTLLSEYANAPVERGLELDAPLAILALAPSDEPEAKSFASDDTDVHRKLLGNEPRRATVDPVRSAERFAVVRGVYQPERSPQGDEWRWLAPDAAIRIPPQHGPAATLTFRVSPDAPFATNEVRINDVLAIAKKDAATKVRVPLTPGANELRIAAKESFVPGRGDARRLAVQLVDVEH
ncbi:MAG TPA: hypothetical protein VF698_01250 [Thermoanaerobaculia bacterium]|jgi:hypothetical protein